MSKNNSVNIWMLNDPRIWGTHLKQRELVMISSCSSVSAYSSIAIICSTALSSLWGYSTLFQHLSLLPLKSLLRMPISPQTALLSEIKWGSFTLLRLSVTLCHSALLWIDFLVLHGFTNIISLHRTMSCRGVWLIILQCKKYTSHFNWLRRETN